MVAYGSRMSCPGVPLAPGSLLRAAVCWGVFGVCCPAWVVDALIWQALFQVLCPLSQKPTAQISDLAASESLSAATHTHKRPKIVSPLPLSVSADALRPLFDATVRSTLPQQHCF
jgi:hypothetical protein